MPGDDSSSPSANSAEPARKGGDAHGDTGGSDGLNEPAGQAHTVVSVELKGAAGEAVRIHLSDGSFFVLHAEVFVREGISAGTPLDAERVAALLTRSERVFARLRALSLLSRAAHSRKGLERKLALRGFSAEAIQDAIGRVSELGYLDDKAFAESWVRAHMSAGKTGWNALYKGLLTRGVARALAEQVVDSLFSWEEEVECARQLADGLSPHAAIHKLTSRGFRSRTISKVLREKKETDPEAPEG